MPELTFSDLPSLLEENKQIRSEVNQLIKEYLKNFHPRGWDIIDGAREYIRSNHYFIEAPINDLSFGGFIRSTNTSKYICYINTFQPRIYQNFCLLHELYHLLSFQQVPELIHMVKAGLDSDTNERKADYFASLLLIDEHELYKFYTGPENIHRDTITKVFHAMARFKSPFKAVLIRLFELELITPKELEMLFDLKIDINNKFEQLGLDPYPVQKSLVVNFEDLKAMMEENNLPELAQMANEGVFNEVASYFSTLKGGD